MNFNDPIAAEQVIGNLFLNNELLNDDRYVLKNDFFEDNRLALIAYASLYNLYKNGMAVVGITNVIEFLIHYPEQNKYFIENKGDSYIESCMKKAEVLNYKYYYERLKKMYMLKSYYRAGFNISELYNPDSKDKVEKQRAEALLESLSPDKISDYFTEKLDNVKMNFTSTEDKGVHAGYELMKTIENYRKSPEFGLSLNGKLLNTVTRGARKKKFYIRSAATGVGKAIPDDILIPTFDQKFKRVDEIKVGDTLIDRKGSPTTVTAIYPQKRIKEIYMITFEDGRKAECCKEHLWTFLYSDKDNNYKLLTKDTNFILKKIKHSSKNKNGEYLFKIPINEPIKFNKIEYNLTAEDFSKALIKIKNNNELNFDNICCKKMIPDSLLFSSIEDRITILKFLLEENGIFKHNFIEYHSNNKDLLKNLSILCRSLGSLAIEELKMLKIKLNKNIALQIFGDRLDLENYCLESAYIGIKSIERTHQKTKMTCFTVNNEENLFLMNDFIVTHNTRTLAGSAASLGVGSYYDVFEKKWIKVNEPKSTLYITSEQEYQEIQTLLLAFVSGIQEQKILNGESLTNDEEERLKKAIKLIENSKLIIEPIGDYGIRQLTSLIKRKKYSDNIEYVFHDYIHSSLTLLNEVGQETRVANLREDQVLLMLCNSLKNLCNDLDIFIFSATQLNRTYKETDELDATVIRGSMAISDKADFVSIMLNVREKEKELIKKIMGNLKDFNKYEPNIVTYISKNRGNSVVNAKLFSCFDKSTCQSIDLFVLDLDNRKIDIEATNIIEKIT